MPSRVPASASKTLERAVDGVIARYPQRRPTPADLARAKTQLVADATYRRDSQFAMASAYGRALAIGLTADDVERMARPHPGGQRARPCAGRGRESADEGSGDRLSDAGPPAPRDARGRRADAK